MSDEATEKRVWTLRFALSTSMTPDATPAMLKYISKHPTPWRADRSNIVDARGAAVVVIDGDGYEERYALAQLLVMLINSAHGNYSAGDDHIAVRGQP